MADWNTPTLTTGYMLFLTYLKDRDSDVATQFNNGTPANTPTGAIKWDTGLNRWNKWSGAAWVELAATYALTALTCTTLSATGNVTFGDAGADTVTINASTGSIPNGFALTGNMTIVGTFGVSGAISPGSIANHTISGTGTISTWTWDTGDSIEYNRSTNTMTITIGTVAGLTVTGHAAGTVLIPQASATAGAGFRLPHGAAPTSPVNGDIWTTTAGMFTRINGVTYQLTDTTTLRPVVSAVSASFTAVDADNNTHKTASGAAQVLTLNSTPLVGTSFTVRFTTAWAITCTSLSKNGAAPASGGTIAANSLITFLHEGSGTWVATGSGLT